MAVDDHTEKHKAACPRKNPHTASMALGCMPPIRTPATLVCNFCIGSVDCESVVCIHKTGGPASGGPGGAAQSPATTAHSNCPHGVLPRRARTLHPASAAGTRAARVRCQHQVGNARGARRATVAGGTPGEGAAATTPVGGAARGWGGWGGLRAGKARRVREEHTLLARAERVTLPARAERALPAASAVRR